jgi:hypothetical protein
MSRSFGGSNPRTIGAAISMANQAAFRILVQGRGFGPFFRKRPPRR